MTDIRNRDDLAQALKEACPIGALSVATPWDALAEPEREAWRVIADAAFAWCGPSPSDAMLAELLAHSTETLQRTRGVFTGDTALRRYARHAEECAQAPCSCGLAARLGDTP